MENNHLDDLIQQGKKQLSELQQQIESLAATAGKIMTSDEVNQKKDELIAEAKTYVDNARTLIESKTKEARQSEQFQNLEAEGKKAVEDAQVKIQELSVKVNDVANELGDKLRGLFGGK